MQESKTSKKGNGHKKLRRGFSTGTAASAAASAALRHLLSGIPADTIAVRLPSGIYLSVSIHSSRLEDGTACASVIKDGGDDPDITNGAEICARVRFLSSPDGFTEGFGGWAGVLLSAGKGVGIVTKPGLPVSPGEPAINPVPRQMLSDNLARELLSFDSGNIAGALDYHFDPAEANRHKPGACATQKDEPAVFLPFDSGCPSVSAIPASSRPFLKGRARGVLDQHVLAVEIEVPRGEKLAKHTLNPRLGIVGGISILGTTGIVKPFSNLAYEQTIQAALSVALANGCKCVILSTGGKSERFARDKLPVEPAEAFVQIADFFEFAVREAGRGGFSRIIHSIFFGKAVKMAQGHSYTHAHSVPMELESLADMAKEAGYKPEFCREVATANTARHALDLLRRCGAASEVIRRVAEKALEQSIRFSGGKVQVRLLLFDYDGSLLADVE